MHGKGRVGDTVSATVPTRVSSIIEFAGGQTATLVTSFDVKARMGGNMAMFWRAGGVVRPGFWQPGWKANMRSTFRRTR